MDNWTCPVHKRTQSRNTSCLDCSLEAHITLVYMREMGDAELIRDYEQWNVGQLRIEYKDQRALLIAFESELKKRGLFDQSKVKYGALVR